VHSQSEFPIFLANFDAPVEATKENGERCKAEGDRQITVPKALLTYGDRCKETRGVESAEKCQQAPRGLRNKGQTKDTRLNCALLPTLTQG
jgi:hypothetical protein